MQLRLKKQLAILTNPQLLLIRLVAMMKMMIMMVMIRLQVMKIVTKVIQKGLAKKQKKKMLVESLLKLCSLLSESYLPAQSDSLCATSVTLKRMILTTNSRMVATFKIATRWTFSYDLIFIKNRKILIVFIYLLTLSFETYR